MEITEFFDITEISGASLPQFPFLEIWTLLIQLTLSSSMAMAIQIDTKMTLETMEKV